MSLRIAAVNAATDFVQIRVSLATYVTRDVPISLSFAAALLSRASLASRRWGTEAPMASNTQVEEGTVKVGDLVEVFDTDGWGADGAWLRGAVYQLLQDGRYRISCVGGGMTDVSSAQTRVCVPPHAGADRQQARRAVSK